MKRQKTSLALWSALVVFGASMGFATAARASNQPGILDGLSSDQQQSLANGEQVFVTEDVDGSAWPRMYIYQVIHCTPEQAEAVTMDYELRPSYTPQLTYAKNEGPLSGSTMLTDYVIHVPIVGDEHFTLSETVSAYAGETGPSYRLDYHMTHGDNTKYSNGYTRFEPYGSGETLMEVVSLIVPDVWGAGLVTGEAESQAKGAAVGFAKQVEGEAVNHPGLLQNQIQMLRKALGQ